MTDRDEKVREALHALDEIEAALDYLRAPTANMPWEAAHLAKVFSLLPTIRAALAHPAPDVPGAEEVEAIRARHEADDDLSGDWQKSNYELIRELRADRATLLRLLDAAHAELAEVREAAGPFSNLWQDISFGNPYATIDQMVWREGEADHGPYEITYGDLRRLAAALAKDAT
jgi:hypothetical protein